MTYLKAWEYLVLLEQEADDLNALGRQGWELAGVGHGALYFKRPAPSFRERVTLDQKRHVYGMRGLPFPDEKGAEA